MAFEDNIPQTADELVQRSKTDVQRELDLVDNENDANAFLKGSWLGAIVTANANRVFDYFLQLTEALRLNFPDTTEGVFADRWGVPYIGTRNAAVGSVGNLVSTGTASSVLPIATNFQSTEGITYTSTAEATITVQTPAVASFTSVGTIATATTDDPHGLASNVLVTTSGAVETEYNITDAEIQVTGANTFTYTLENSTTSPATGTPAISFTAATVPVEAVPPSDPDDPFGAASNQTLDTPLTLQSAISGVDNVANVDIGELAGGADLESDDDYKTRYLDKMRNPVAHFSPADIDQKIRDDVAGVTRIFINKSGDVITSDLSVTSITRVGGIATATTASDHNLFTGGEVTITGAVETEYNVTNAKAFVISSTKFEYLITGTPTTPATGTILTDVIIGLGFVQIYFTRDLDDTPIPNQTEIDDVKTTVLEITPASTPDTYVIVLAPTALPVAFTFSELTPDTPSMRTAVTAQLQQFFDEEVSVGVNIDEDAYRSAIFTTVDTESNTSVESFELGSPTGDVSVGVGELPTLGTVIFP